MPKHIRPKKSGAQGKRFATGTKKPKSQTRARKTHANAAKSNQTRFEKVQKPRSKKRSARKTKEELDKEYEAEIQAFVDKVKAEMEAEDARLEAEDKAKGKPGGPRKSRAKAPPAPKKSRFRLAKKKYPKETPAPSSPAFKPDGTWDKANLARRPDKYKKDGSSSDDSDDDSESSLDPNETIADLGRRLNRLAPQKAEQKIDDGIMDSDEEMPEMKPIKSAMKVTNAKKALSRAKRFGVKFTENPQKGDEDVVQVDVEINPEGRVIPTNKVIHVANKPVPTINMARPSGKNPNPPQAARKPILIRPRAVKAAKPKPKTIITGLKGPPKPAKTTRELVQAAKSTKAAYEVAEKANIPIKELVKMLSEIKTRTGKRKFSDAAIRKVYNSKVEKSKRLKPIDLFELVAGRKVITSSNK